jgi:hypothetical protein
MKTIRFAAMALMALAISHVQAQYALQTGKMQFNGGIGLSNIGWLSAGLDYGYDKNISLGGELSVGTFGTGLGSYSSVIGLSGNANYHFVELLQIDDIYDVCDYILSSHRLLGHRKFPPASHQAESCDHHVREDGADSGVRHY